MKPFFLIFCIVAALIVTSCRREEAITQQEGAPTTTQTTLTGPPQDMAVAEVKAAIAPDQARYVSESKIGSTVGADGLVADEKTDFAPGEGVHLSMWLKESPAELQTSAKLEDADGKEIDVQRRTMKGEKTVTFSFDGKKLKPGTYKVTGYWGGNVAAEQEITVGERPKS